MTSTSASDTGLRKEGASTEIKSAKVSNTMYRSIWWVRVDLILLGHDSGLAGPYFQTQKTLCVRSLLASPTKRTPEIIAKRGLLTMHPSRTYHKIRRVPKHQLG